jgi:hypothetical protein
MPVANTTLAMIPWRSCDNSGVNRGIQDAFDFIGVARLRLHQHSLAL